MPVLQPNRRAVITPNVARTYTLPPVTSGDNTPDNGTWCEIEAATLDDAPVTVDTSGTDTIYSSNTGSVSSTSGPMIGHTVRFTYFSNENRWQAGRSGVVEHYAMMYGAPNNINPGASYTPIVGYVQGLKTPLFDTVNTATGEITAPRAGVFMVSALYNFNQGNTNKELACSLRLRVQGVDSQADSIQISDDKTDERALGLIPIPISVNKGDVIQLGMLRVNQSMGSCSFNTAAFRLEYVDSGSLLSPAVTVT